MIFGEFIIIFEYWFIWIVVDVFAFRCYLFEAASTVAADDAEGDGILF